MAAPLPLAMVRIQMRCLPAAGMSDQFAVMPELGVTLSYAITSNLEATVGYRFLYMSRVARAGDQIDLDLDLVGSTRPVFAFEHTDFEAPIKLGVFTGTLLSGVVGFIVLFVSGSAKGERVEAASAAQEFPEVDTKRESHI